MGEFGKRRGDPQRGRYVQAKFVVSTAKVLHERATAHQADAARVYHIIFVVVAFSVIVQGGLVPAAAGRLGVPMRIVEPEPFAAGIRLRHEPRGVHRYRVTAGSLADGAVLADLQLGDAWISLLARDGHLLPVGPGLVLRAGDELLIQAGEGDSDPGALFCAPA